MNNPNPSQSTRGRITSAIAESARASSQDAEATAGSQTPHSQAGSVRQRPRFQISLSLMMLAMIVFAVISAGLFYASNVPVIRDEISVALYGKTSNAGEDVGRMAHRVFIMFTFTSPLLLACVLSLGLSAVKWLEKRNG